MSYCTNCGAKLSEGAKFCGECGTKVASNEAPQSPVESHEDSSSHREQKFVGKIYKCPNCGETVDGVMAICPYCHHRLSDKSASSVVTKFSEQLLEIENERKESGKMGMFGTVFSDMAPASKADKKILSLVKSFPIPNTVEDITEFMLLADTNIDPSLSKKSLLNKMNSINRYETSTSIRTTISDAWVAKMEQAYKKAKLSFQDDPLFPKIEKIYLDKMKELKIKID